MKISSAGKESGKQKLFTVLINVFQVPLPLPLFLFLSYLRKESKHFDFHCVSKRTF